MGEPAQNTTMRIDVARECDAPFVYATWMASYRDSPLGSKWDDAEYRDRMNQRMASLIERSVVYVARPSDWDEGVIGWAVAEQRGGRFLLHYCFVRPPFRQQGVLTALIAQHAPRGQRLITTLRPPFTQYIKRLGFRFEHRRKDA